jgi:hypothetical protein
MAATGYLAKGRKLYLSTDAGATYVQLVDVRTMSDLGGGKAPQVDVTPLDSAGSRREKLPGMIDTEDFSFEQLYTAARYATLKAQLRVSNKWRATTPQFATTPSKYEFDGALSELSLGGSGNTDDPVVIKGSVTVTGDITQTVGS